MFFQNIFVRNLGQVEMTERFVDASQIVGDGDGDGTVVGGILFGFPFATRQRFGEFLARIF